jgi:hypothetical protein
MISTTDITVAEQDQLNKRKNIEDPFLLISPYPKKDWCACSIMIEHPLIFTRLPDKTTDERD